jgi:hypothetical protein
MSIVVRPPPVRHTDDTVAGSDPVVRSADESDVDGRRAYPTDVSEQ